MADKPLPTADNSGARLRIPVVEEQLDVGKQTVETGRFTVRSRVVSETVPVLSLIQI